MTNVFQPNVFQPDVFQVLGVDATGGNSIVRDGAYRVHVFTADGTLSVAEGFIIDAEVLVVGGGGGARSGAGGAGGFLTGAETLTGEMSVIVGSGGAHGHGSSPNIVAPTAGGDSTFGSRTAYGGGRGGYSGGATEANGGVGASGGGGNGSTFTVGGSASPPGQGHAGGGVGSVTSPYHSGGGGGAGAVGGAGGDAGNGDGGAGLNSDIVENGVNVGYAGGGGGGCASGGTAGTASHGGGAGAVANGTAGSGAANTGGGGGGCGPNGSGGDGAAGIVIIRYLNAGAKRLEAHGVVSLDGVAGLFLWGLARLGATGGITLPGTATLWSMFSSIDMTPSGNISLFGAAALSNDSRLVGSTSIALGGSSWLTSADHGDDTMEARGFIHTGGRARLNIGEVWPATDDDGWTTPDVDVPAIRSLVVSLSGLTFNRAQITDLTIELGIEGGPLSATLSLNCALDRAPRIGKDTLLVSYGQVLFRGRLEHMAGSVDASTGYSLTFAGPMIVLRDHKSYRTVFVDSDLDNWSTDQGPRTSPDTFEVASRSSGATV